MLYESRINDSEGGVMGIQFIHTAGVSLIKAPLGTCKSIDFDRLQYQTRFWRSKSHLAARARHPAGSAEQSLVMNTRIIVYINLTCELQMND